MAYIYALALERGYKADDFGYDIDNLLNYIRRELAQKTDIHYDYERAYACYIHALLGKPNMNVIQQNLYAKRKELSLSTNALIAFAYLAGSNGDSTEAKTIAQEIRDYLQIDGRTVSVIPLRSDKGGG